MEEIDHAVDLLKSLKACFSLLHCNSTYPAPKHELNLNNIKMLRDRYNVKIGYSGHESDLEPSVLACALGANIIERHVTLDHMMWGTDQKSSLEVHAMNMLRKRCDAIKNLLHKFQLPALGTKKRLPQ